MKLTRGNLTRFILLPAIGSGILPVSLYPEERESFDEEEIRHIVVEAKEMAREWADRIRSWKGGQNTSSTYIGIVIEPVPDVLRDYVDLPKGVGLLLPRIAGGGPAEKAGLKDNDILVQFDGQWVINYSQLSTLIEMKGAGATVPVKILRKGVEMSFEITIEERDHQTQHPPLPKAPASPSPPGDVGALMEQIDEWIPGSVRVYVSRSMSTWRT
jgi:membrane-associated protease RseP (regulator of RpoE activity)